MYLPCKQWTVRSVQESWSSKTYLHHEADRQDHESVEHRVVLEMDVINHKHTEREVVDEKPNLQLFAVGKSTIGWRQLCLCHESIASINKKKVCRDDTHPMHYHRSLREHFLIDLNNIRIYLRQYLGEHPLKISKEWRIVKSMLQSILKVPFLHWQRVCESEPVTVHIKVCRKALPR